MANKSIFKKPKKKQIVVCVYLFSWKPQIKQKANQTKQKMLFTSFKNYSRKQYSKNSDIVADTNHTQKRKTCKNTAKENFSIQNYFSPDISKRNLVKSINKSGES